VTVPTFGFPDYQRVSAQAGDTIYSVQQVLSTNIQSPVLDAHGYGYLDFSVNYLGGVSFFWIQLAWKVNADGTGEVSTYAFTPTPGGEQTLQIPVVSRYFVFSAHVISGPGTEAPFISVFGTQVAHANSLNSQPAQPFLIGAQSIAAGANAEFVGTTTIQGGALLCITDSGDNNWFALVQYFDKDTAAWTTFLTLFGANYGQTATLMIGVPPAPIRVEVHNTGTAAHTFTVSIGIT
jgi:hypothetical protein